MLTSKRVPTGLWIAAAIMALPVATITASEGRSSLPVASQIYTLGLYAVNPTQGRVSEDFGIAYSARCHAPISAGKLHSQLHSSTGEAAISAANAFKEEIKACAVTSCQQPSAGEAAYIQAISDISCA